VDNGTWPESICYVDGLAAGEVDVDDGVAADADDEIEEVPEVDDAEADAAAGSLAASLAASFAASLLDDSDDSDDSDDPFERESLR
jgi:hypothetical protein